MTAPAVPVTAPAVPGPVCPHLGLEDDPASHFAFPSSAQRCHASGRPFSVESAKQARDCLTAAHVTCPRYRPPAPTTGGAALVLAAVSAETPRRSAGARPSIRRIVNVALAVILAVGAALGGLVLGSRLADRAGGGAGDAGGSPAAGVSTVPASVAPLTTPTATPAPTPTASPTTATGPTPSPTAATTPAPTPVTHRVKPGETLTTIAALYGVTVAALEKANRIADPNLIFTGQVLVIPVH